MSNTKISALIALITPQTGDLIPIVDVSDITQAASGSTKKITRENLFAIPPPVGSTTPNSGAFTTISETGGFTGTTGTMSTAITDNTSTSQIDTTAFAKSQDAILRRDPDQAVALQAGAWAAIKVPHSTVFSATTNNGGYGGDFACPLWAPAATQVLINKWAANVGYKLELILTSGIIRLTLNATAYDSAVPGGGAASNLLAGSRHNWLAAVTVGATTTTVSFLLDGVLLSTTAAQTNVDVTNTQDFYVGGTSAVTYAMTVYDVYHLNLAPSAAVWRLAYLEGIPESWKWGSQTAVSSDTEWTGASGATPPTGWTAALAGLYSIINDGGDYTTALKIEVNATPIANPWIYKAVPTVVGKKYRAGIYCKYGSGDGYRFRVGSTVGESEYYGIDSLNTSWTLRSVEFTALTTTTYISLRTLGASVGHNNFFDNSSLYKIGATLAFLPESWQPDKPYDLTGVNACAYPASGWSLTRPPAKKTMQPTPTDGSTGAVTVTIAMILNGIITGNPSAARDYTFETGATSDAWPSLAIDRGYEWSIINTNATYAITVVASSGHTIIGNAVVVLSTTGRFLTRKTAASTFISYRIS